MLTHRGRLFLASLSPPPIAFSYLQASNELEENMCHYFVSQTTCYIVLKLAVSRCAFPLLHQKAFKWQIILLGFNYWNEIHCFVHSLSWSMSRCRLLLWFLPLVNTQIHNFTNTLAALLRESFSCLIKHFEEEEKRGSPAVVSELRCRCCRNLAALCRCICFFLYSSSSYSN